MTSDERAARGDPGVVRYRPTTASSCTRTTECANCGRQRYIYERCPHCGHVHWR